MRSSGRWPRPGPSRTGCCPWPMTWRSSCPAPGRCSGTACCGTPRCDHRPPDRAAGPGRGPPGRAADPGPGPDLSPAALRRAAALAAAQVNPAKAKNRREHGARDARVERWREDSGNAGLAGRELPAAQVLAMDQRITWWARELQAAGVEGGMDLLRARALTDLLLNQDSRPAASRGTTPHDTGADHPAGPHRAPGPVPAPSPAPAGIPAGFAGRNHLTIPLATLLGLADRPGQLDGLGPVDPWQARDLAAASAANPETTWCLTVTDHRGRAAGHACARPEPRATPGSANEGRPQRPARPAPPAPGSPSPPPDPGRPADTAPGGSPPGSPASGPGSSTSTPSPPVPATTATKPTVTTPAPSSGTSPRSATPLHRPHVPASLNPRRLRAQHPVRSRRPDVPL